MNSASAPAQNPARNAEALVRLALQGDAKAFEALVKQYYGMVYAVALAHISDRETAEELAQEVFLRVMLHLRRLDDPRRFSAWLTRLARNLAIDWRRRGQRASRLLPLVPIEEAAGAPDLQMPNARQQLSAKDDQRIVHEALAQLPGEDREIVLLRFMEDLGTDEIADRLGVHRSTVRRRLDRVLCAMRQTIEGAQPNVVESALSKATPALRAQPAAAVRATMIIAAAAALTAAQKSALAAAASAGDQAIEAKAAAAASVGILGYLVSLAKSIAPLFGAGGVSMTLGKSIAVTAAAVAFVGGGTFYYTSHHSESRLSGGPPSAAAAPAAAAPSAAPGAPSASNAAVQGLSLLAEVQAAPESSPSLKYRDWGEWAHAYAAEHPENKGLPLFLAALDKYNQRIWLPKARILDEIRRTGFLPEHAAIGQAMDTQAGMLQSAYAAAGMTPFGLPEDPSYDPSCRIFNFLACQNIIKIMAADALRWQAAGQADAAADRAVLAIRLATIFNHKGANFFSHLSSTNFANFGLQALAPILRDPRLTPAAAQRAGLALHEITSNRVGMIEGYRREAHCALALTERFRKNPNEFESPGITAESREILKRALGDYDNFKAEHQQAWSKILAIYEQPAWRRERVNEQWINANIRNSDLRNLLQGSVDEALFHEDVMLARIRVCEALCALRMNRPELLAQIVDPFTGGPIQTSPQLQAAAANAGSINMIYSVGPDKTDQKAAIQFDPSKGICSEGDITAATK